MGEPFAAIVGADRVSAGEAPLAGAAVSAVVRPRTAAETAACLGAAARESSPVVARGGGSKLHWGNPLDAASVSVLDLGALDAIDLQPDEGIATLGPGVALDTLDAAAAGRGMYTLLDPLYPGATVGGTVAADPVVPGHSLDRRLRGDLLGLEVALANGELTRSGGRVMKNVTGFDLVRLYCGSLGTLGVITEVTLRLRARPAVQRVLRRAFGDLEAALAAAGELVLAPIELGGVGLRPADGGFELLWRLEGTERSVDEFAARAAGEPAPGEHWESLRACVAAHDSDATRVRLGARASDTGALCRSLAQDAGERALRVALPTSGVAFADTPADALPALYRRAEREHWSLFVERAPAGAGIDVFGPAPDSLPLMRALKQRFDPARVLAPGRFVGRL